jgi:hypothetical protein
MPKRIRETRRPISAVTGFGHTDQMISRTHAMRAIGEVVYAVRVNGLVKIGHTSDLAQRISHLHADEVLAFAPGTLADEQALHRSLTAHRRPRVVLPHPGRDDSRQRHA